MKSDPALIDRLLDRIASLETEIALLRDYAGLGEYPVDGWRDGFKLQRREYQIGVRIARVAPVHVAIDKLVMIWDDIELTQCPSSLVFTHVHRLRRKLARHEVSINHDRNFGYWMPKPDAAKFLTLCGG